LPPFDLKEREFEELSIQDWIWLGGENILGLSYNTNGVVAAYELGGVPVRLLLIEHPTDKQATDAAQAIQSNQVDDLLTVQTQDTMLIAVFGSGDKTSAEALTADVLRNINKPIMDTVVEAI
jgi:hypothetical protein